MLGGIEFGANTVNELPFRTLLYRYFFFGWLFRDMRPGNLFEIAAARRHNRQQARWLPVYMLRWAWLGLAFYAFAGLGEMLLLTPVEARWLYAASAMCLSVTVTTITAWVGLIHGDQML